MALMTPISSQIWDMKYRLKAVDGAAMDKTLEDSWQRVAGALAAPEDDAEHWQAEFYKALEDFRFLPAGRILAGAGTERHVLQGVVESLRRAGSGRPGRARQEGTGPTPNCP